MPIGVPGWQILYFPFVVEKPHWKSNEHAPLAKVLTSWHTPFTHALARPFGPYPVISLAHWLFAEHADPDFKRIGGGSLEMITW